MYQRSKIQEESLYYEAKKHDGSLPIIGVNTFLDPKGSPTIVPSEVRRSTTEEKEFAIACRDAFWQRNADAAERWLAELQRAAVENRNLFEVMMEASKVCTLGQLAGALYEVGGQYRRNM
jgi:methylmalonyl-CoA mutase